MTRARITLLVLLIAAGCQTARTAYYNAWEGMGYAKRQRLVDNVKAAQKEQTEAKEQFVDALTQFRSVVNFDGGDLEATYNKLNKSYEASSSQADDVNTKITSVKNVAKALFAEWQGEIKEIKDDPALSTQSQTLLEKTRSNYDQMIQRMDAAAATMQPVLTKLHNRVLFLKHNLNAQAIASLKGTEMDLSGDVDKLLAEMEKSIAEADTFIAGMTPKS